MAVEFKIKAVDPRLSERRALLGRGVRLRPMSSNARRSDGADDAS